MSQLPEDVLSTADVVIWVKGDDTRVFRPARADGARVAPISAPVPARLLLALSTIHDVGLGEPAWRELRAWLRANTNLDEALQGEIRRSRPGRIGALVYVRCSAEYLDRPLESWWISLGDRLVAVPERVSGPRALRAFRAVVRAQEGWKSAAALALLAAAGVQLAFAWTLPAQRLDDFCYAFSSLWLPRPALTDGAEVLLLPEVQGAAGRTDRALLANVLTVATERGAAVIGMDAMLDVEGDPSAAASLAAVLAAKRDQVVAVEFPESVVEPGHDALLVVEPFYSALCPGGAGACGGADRRAPVAYGGVFDYNPGDALNRTRLFFDETERLRAQASYPTDLRWGSPVLPVLGTEVYRRWCAGLAVTAPDDGCWPFVGEWRQAVRMRFPEVQTRLTVLRPEQDQPDEIRAALDQQGVDLRGKALFVSSWDRTGDATAVPVLDKLGPGDSPGYWPGVLVQAAIFHTLVERDPLWDLRDRVDRAANGRQHGVAGLAVVWAWLASWGMVAALGALVGARGRWLLPGLAVVISALSFALLAQGSLWLPLPATIFCVLISWGLSTRALR